MAAWNVFLTVQGIERDQMACEAKLGEQRLGGGDLVRLLGDVAVRQHQRGVGGEDAEQLRGGAVAELIEAAAERHSGWATPVLRDPTASAKRAFQPEGDPLIGTETL